MSHKEYLGEIGFDDLKELFLYRNASRCLRDIVRTLKKPNEVVAGMLDGLSENEVEKEAESYIEKKNKKFQEIYNKHQWMQVTDIPHLQITEDGKVYRDCSPNGECKCGG